MPFSRIIDATLLSPKEDEMLDHVGVNVRDYARSHAFYERALEPLGYRPVLVFEEHRATGFGVEETKPTFWVAQREPFGTGTHVAFACSDHAAVDAFHATALEAGGEDNGAPGPRPHYHETYYAAFVLDPDGNNVEAVCHREG
ncbi:MAG TPA: VOC family protein [Gaiellaceae bacterium]|jgi:catechol 2,3-dioxygenase-like lactoylglutathione lyase family enzyme|nr:VOC family protein [Gaiellaceae bacterium]